jgi:hypothetical protein
LDFDAYQGHFSAAGTNADLGPAKPTFDVRANVRNVSLMPLLTEQAKLPDALSGRFSGRVALKGRGTAWPDVSRSLDGTLQATVTDGKFHKADLPSELLAPLAKRLPFLKLPKGPKVLAFRDVQGAFRVEDGRARLQQPLRLRTPQGPLTLTGWLGLDKTMKLDGQLEMWRDSSPSKGPNGSARTRSWPRPGKPRPKPANKPGRRRRRPGRRRRRRPRKRSARRRRRRGRPSRGFSEDPRRDNSASSKNGRPPGGLS